MFETFKIYKEAKHIVDIAQQASINRENSDKRLEDDSLGFHMSYDVFSPDYESNFEKLKGQMGRPFPYRTDGQNGHMIIVRPGKENIISSGNELNNNINDQQLDAKQWEGICVSLFRQYNGDIQRLASPALMTLKQNKKFWPQILHCEAYFDYWCLNTHIPGFIRRKESGIGDYIEIIKTVAELIKFRNKTTKKIIISEMGNGEYHYALTRGDVNMLYWVHKQVFGDRMVLGLYYNDALMMRSNGFDQIRARK